MQEDPLHVRLVTDVEELLDILVSDLPSVLYRKACGICMVELVWGSYNKERPATIFLCRAQLDLKLHW